MYRAEYRVSFETCDKQSIVETSSAIIDSTGRNLLRWAVNIAKFTKSTVIFIAINLLIQGGGG